MLSTTFDLMTAAAASDSAVPAFNVYNLTMAKAVIELAEENHVPVIIACGTAPLNETGLDVLGRGLLDLARRSTTKVSVHLDHIPNVEMLVRWAQLGGMSGMIDGSKLSFEDNVNLTKTARESLGSAFWLEGELGRIEGQEDQNIGAGDSSATQSLQGYTDVTEARLFCSETGVDGLAVAVGNVHGRYSVPPTIQTPLLAEIRAAVTVPLVLHGASGLTNKTLKEVTQLGIRKINFNFELRTALLRGLRSAVEEQIGTDKYDLMELSRVVKDALRETVVGKFTGLGTLDMTRF